MNDKGLAAIELPNLYLLVRQSFFSFDEILKRNFVPT
jgi:hypothetical protein